MSELQVYHWSIIWNNRSDNHRSPRAGIFVLAEENVRKLPTVTDNQTHETIHPSVLRQKNPIPINPALVCKLLPLEEELQKNWPYVEGKHVKNQSDGSMHMLSITSARSFLFDGSTEQVVLVAKTDSIQTQAITSQTGNGHSQSRPSRLALLGAMCREFLLTSG